MVSNDQAEALCKQLKLYFIMGSINCKKNPAEVLKEAIAGGITFFQFREKGTGALTGEDKFSLAVELQKICRDHGIPFIVNDDIELAIRLDADGVHIGQEDESVEAVRAKIGAEKILGVSAHSVEEVESALRDGADYLGIGPVFATTTKEDAKPAAGVTLIKTIREMGMSTPVVGIGGINAENAAIVTNAGADGVSVISAISLAENITEAARQIKKAIE